jgi:hypothetical protein
MKSIYSKTYAYIFITFNRHWPDDNPEWSAGILFPIMLLFIIVFLIVAFNLVKFIHSIADLRIVGLVLYASLVVTNYFLFIRSGKFKEFRDNFYGLEKGVRRKKYVTGLLITMGGYLIPIVGFIFVMVVFH